MKNPIKYSLLTALSLFAATAAAGDNMHQGDPQFSSMNALAFNAQGVLFIGDSLKGDIVAINMAQSKAARIVKPPSISGLDGKIAALVGAKPSDILIHDMAVNPISKNIYLSISREGSKWYKGKTQPNAAALIKVNLDSTIELVNLANVKYSTASLPNPVDKNAMRRGYSKRVRAITKMAFKGDKLYVSGMSNEEFASSLWTFSYPFNDQVSASTIEVFHGAHGSYETHAPIRTFLPYEFNQKDQMLAAYACTPLVSIQMDALKDKAHVKGKTIAELGAGNGPIDIIAYQYQGEKKILMSNSRQPLMAFKATDVAAYKGSMTTRAKSYTEGVKFDAMSYKGVQQIDNFNSQFVLTTTKLPSGEISLTSIDKSTL